MLPEHKLAANQDHHRWLQFSGILRYQTASVQVERVRYGICPDIASGGCLLRAHHIIHITWSRRFAANQYTSGHAWHALDSSSMGATLPNVLKQLTDASHIHGEQLADAPHMHMHAGMCLAGTTRATTAGRGSAPWSSPRPCSPSLASPSRVS